MEQVNNDLLSMQKIEALKNLKYIFKCLLIVPLFIVFTPVRFVFDFFTLRHPDLFRKTNTPENHKRKVETVQNQVLQWIRNGRKTKMCTARPGWQSLCLRALDKSSMTKIKLDLEDIVEVDTKKKILRVEPGIKMGTLMNKLLKLGWTIPIVPELETLTIGGLINGAGLETSSHKYGIFADPCLEYEVVLADGSVVRCSEDENSELFHAIPMSHGTIGFLTEVTIPIIPASRYVKLEYIPTASIKETNKLLQKSDCDFVEGIMYDRNRSVIMYGTMVDEAEPDKINYINRWHKKFFYSQVEKFLKEGKSRNVEYIPLRDYYFRHQRGCFWETTYILPLFNNQLFLYLFDWAHPGNFQLNKFLANMMKCDYDDLLLSKKHMIQDFVLPVHKFENAIEFAHKEVEIYPIWLCPVMANSRPGMEDAYLGGVLHIDIGIYGDVEKDLDMEKTCRQFEKFCRDNKGFQGLYADVYMSREEFRQMFKPNLYDRVREQYGCIDAFPEVYDKVCLAARKGK